MLTHLTAGMLLRRSLPRASGHTSRGVLTPAPLKPTKCTQRLVANTRVTRYGRPAAALYICNRYQLTCTFLPRYGRVKFCHYLSMILEFHRMSQQKHAFRPVRAPRSRLTLTHALWPDNHIGCFRAAEARHLKVLLYVFAWYEKIMK